MAAKSPFQWRWQKWAIVFFLLFQTLVFKTEWIACALPCHRLIRITYFTKTFTTRCVGLYVWFDKALTTAWAKICNTFKSAAFFLINTPTCFLWWSDEPDQIVGWSAQRLHPDSSRNCSSTQRLRVSNEAVVTRGKDLMSVCCSQGMVDGGAGGCWICLSTTLRDHSFSLCTDLEIEEIVKS